MLPIEFSQSAFWFRKRGEKQILNMAAIFYVHDTSYPDASYQVWSQLTQELRGSRLLKQTVDAARSPTDTDRS